MTAIANIGGNVVTNNRRPVIRTEPMPAVKPGHNMKGRDLKYPYLDTVMSEIPMGGWFYADEVSADFTTDNRTATHGSIHGYAKRRKIKVAVREEMGTGRLIAKRIG
jgi:hypothetical protein